MTEQVILVDEHDNPIGTQEKMAAHEQALLHRAFSVFVITRQQGEIFTLLQQRASSKYHCGSLWTNTCCSHPRPGETVYEAGQRRLPEEMGIDVALESLHKAGDFLYQAGFENGLTEHEFDHVLYCELPIDITFEVNPNEVMATRWISFTELFKEIELSQDKFTPWLKPAAKLAYAKVSGEMSENRKFA